MTNSFFRNPKLWTEEPLPEHDGKNPIANNPEKYIRAKNYLTQDSFMKQFHNRLVSRKTEIEDKMAYLRDRQKHESNDFLTGRLNEVQTMLREINGMITAGDMGEKIIADRENARNKKK